eukprot:3906909-Pyramimonas_sp.AAC.1
MKGVSLEARGNRWADFAAGQGGDLHAASTSDALFMKLLYKAARKPLARMAKAHTKYMIEYVVPGQD